MQNKNGNQFISSFSGGMNVDLDIHAIKGEQYRYAENARVTAGDSPTMGSISPVELPRLIDHDTFAGMDIVGTVTIRDYCAVFANDGLNGRIFRFHINQHGELISQQVFSSTHLFSEKISFVSRYNNDNDIRIYFAEPNNPIRSINIMAVASHNNIDNLSFTPTFNSVAPYILGLTTGQLRAGRISYCYRMYSSTGTESLVSAISSVVSIYSSDILTRSSSIIGSNQDEFGGEITNKGVMISVPLSGYEMYDMIRIYSIYQHSSQSEPKISVIADTKITNNGGRFIFSDYGNSVLDEMTQLEFDQIGLNLFYAKYIESKDDILFAGNIKEYSPEFEDYDVRAYAFNSSGNTVLWSADLATQKSFSGGTIHLVPKDHDCINKHIYEKEKYSDVGYKYDLSGNLGGQGPNVRYNFANTYLIESYGGYLNNGNTDVPYSESELYTDRRIARIGDIKRNISAIRIKSSLGGSMSNPGMYSDLGIGDTIGVEPHSGYLNYANPLISEKLASYMRDEIYRFGAVLHDSLGRRSDVKWIADIRFPAGYYKDSKWSANQFEDPSESDDPDYMLASGVKVSGIDLSRQELLVKPLGLRFEFSNIPSSVTRIEIVRSRRDINNRTILFQAATQKVGTKKQEMWSQNEELPGPIQGTLIPHPIIAMGYSYSVLSPWAAIPNRYNPSLYLSSGFNYYSVIGSNYSPEGLNNRVRTHFNYTDHALAPYYVDNRHFMLISPEASYYGDDYVSNIISSYSSIKLVPENIIYPKSTPLSVGLSSSSHGTSYIGSDINNSFYADRVIPGSSNIRYPSALSFAADITPEMLGDKTIRLLGFVGIVGFKNSVCTGDFSVPNTYTSSGGIPNSSICDIYPSGSHHTEPANRAYISIGGALIIAPGKNENESEYFSGMLNPDNSVSYNGFRLTDSNIGRVNAYSATFKYFCSYSRAIGPFVGGLYFKTIKQLTNNIEGAIVSGRLYDISDIDTISLSSIGYSGVIPSNTNVLEATPFYRSIGSKLFLNYSKSLTRGDSVNARTFDKLNPSSIIRGKINGIHGDGIIASSSNPGDMPSIDVISSSRKKYFNLPNRTDSVQCLHVDTYGSSALSTFIFNAKSMSYSIYGGPSKQQRDFSLYVSTGYSILNDGSDGSAYVFGGDTYIGIFDYTVIHASDQHPGDTSNGISSGISYTKAIQSYPTASINAMIPIETQINMRMSSSKSYVTSGYNYNIQKEPGSYDPFLSIYQYLDSNPGMSAGKRLTTQFLPQFKYNSGYSAERLANTFLTRLNTDIDDSLDYRVLASEKKSTLERFDSWSIFKPANYIDVDARYGEITRLKLFNDRLFFFQENAVGILSVNDRSLIQDNNIGQLVLGTGGVLQRYDYINKNNGLHKDAINSIATSPSGMYWYDHGRNEFCIQSEGVGSLSKIHGVQGIFNRHSDDIEMNIPIGYSRKYNEIMLTLTGVDNIKNSIINGNA